MPPEWWETLFTKPGRWVDPTVTPETEEDYRKKEEEFRQKVYAEERRRREQEERKRREDEERRRRQRWTPPPSNSGHTLQWAAVLNIAKDATPEQAEAAFRRLARENHPDRNPGDAGAEARFKDINNAYAAYKRERGVK